MPQCLSVQICNSFARNIVATANSVAKQHLQSLFRYSYNKRLFQIVCPLSNHVVSDDIVSPLNVISAILNLSTAKIYVVSQKNIILLFCPQITITGDM